MKKLCLFVVIFLYASLFSAISPDWQGPTTDSDWTNPLNWDLNFVPNAIDDTANFKNLSPGGTVALDVSQTVGTLNFDLSASYTIAPILLTHLTLDVSTGSAAITITNVNGNGAHTISADLELLDPLIITQGSTGNFTISGGISEVVASQTLTKWGPGVLVLSSAAGNSYTGTTTINAGTISVVSATDNQLGTGEVVSIGTATLQFDNSAAIVSTRNYTLNGSAAIDTASALNSLTITPASSLGITGGGSLAKMGPGTLILTTTNTYLGGTSIDSGILQISNDNQLGNVSGSLRIGTGTLRTTSGITSSRSGSFTGSPSTIDTVGNSDTFTGHFSGLGSLSILGGGTVFLLGTNSYLGPTALSGVGTTLKGTTNGIQGNVQLNAGTLLTFDQNFNGTYRGKISSVAAGNGTLTKEGLGIVELSGNSSDFSGPTNITMGTLIVNGSLTNSSLTTVSAGATLGGAGTVGATTNNGTIAPGNSIGTLTINGNLILGPTSNVIIDIDPLNADRIAVTGTATINGALTIVPIPGFFGFNQSYTILTSSNLILAPEFNPITSTHLALIPTVIYTGTDVLLNVVITEPFVFFHFSNVNTAAVGNNIDALYAANQLSQDLFNVFNTFIGQSFDTINDALDQMHPAPYSAFTEMQAEVNGQLISLFHRLPYLPCSCNNPNRLWIEGFGNSLTVKRHGLEIGFQANSGGLAFGYDGQVNDSLVLGIGGAWTNNHLDWHDHRGNGTVNGLYGSLYFDSQVGSFYFGGTFLAGMDFYDTNRSLDFLTTHRKATAQFEAFDMVGQIATAYLFGSPQAFFYPYANLDYLYLHTYKFNENGADGLNLDVSGRTDGTLRTEMGLGFQVQDRNAAETVCISPVVSIGWVNMCPIARPKLESTFQGATIPFEVIGWDESWNLLNINFGLSIAYRCFSVMLDYNVEFSPDSGTLLYNQHGNLRLDWKW